MSENNTATASTSCRPEQHVHEILGSTVIAERCECAHNHRFATVSGEAIPVGDGRHVHFANSCTTSADGHTHEFRVATLIDNPIEESKRKYN